MGSGEEILAKMIADPRLREDDKSDRGDDKEGCGENISGETRRD